VDFLLDYAGFLLRVVTLVVAFVVLLSSIAMLRKKGRERSGHLEVHKVNEFYEDLQGFMEEMVLDPIELKEKHKAKAKAEKAEQAAKKKALKAKKKEENVSSDEHKPRVFILDFDGDIAASATLRLRHEITALLSLATSNDEVLVRLESPGGLVSNYGLAASQLARIRKANIPLTVCIDKVAASGGYMMACVANKIISAPFAMIGSIGVVAQVPNFHRLLKKNSVDFEVLTAGEYKRTLTVFGENTEKGREKFQQDLDDTHKLFKDFVGANRPQLVMEQIATGEVWLGQAALEKQLVDELATSDEYLAEKAKTADLFALHYVQKKRLQERLGLATANVFERLLLRLTSKLAYTRFW